MRARIGSHSVEVDEGRISQEAVRGILARNQFAIPCKPISITLVGQMVSGKNRVMVRRDGKHYPQKAFVSWRAQAHLQILEQVPCLTPPIHTPVTLLCQYWPGDKRIRDVDGMLSALGHVLVYAEVLKDDGLIYDVSWHRYPACQFPKIAMEITPWG